MTHYQGDDMPQWLPRSQRPLSFAVFGVGAYLGGSAILTVGALLVIQALRML